MFEPIITANIHYPDSEKIAVYLAHGGYEAARQALTQHSPEELIDIVKRSGLRGRGGAGFPAGVKWGFMPKDPAIEKIVAVNADEGEPGTFKDRLIIECDPHSVIEGMIIAAYAVGAHQAYIYIRGEFFLGYQRLIESIDEARKWLLGKNIFSSNTV
jgi:NADH-quinone oxidoreductase subunit F